VRTVQVLGIGCPKCRLLAASAEAAARELGIPCAIEKITDLQRITGFGVAVLPALVIDGVVKSVGKVPDIDEIKALLLVE
jgi:small redox-active disulfide protein 2